MVFAGLPFSLDQVPSAAPRPAQEASLATADDRQEILREFIEAFNERDFDGLLTHITEDIQWVSVEGAKAVVLADGEFELATSLESYFEASPTSRSSLEWIKTAGSRLTALERVTWTNQAGKDQSQVSLSVYEFKGEKIARVHYFPAEALASGSETKNDSGR